MKKDNVVAEMMRERVIMAAYKPYLPNEDGDEDDETNGVDDD